MTDLVTAMNMDCHANLLLDYYSVIMAITYTSLDCTTLPEFSSACKRGDLIRVEGVLLRVDQEAFMQGMECKTC